MRIVGVNIPDNKMIEIALTYVHGVGRVSARDILTKAKIAYDKHAKDLSADEVNVLKKILEKEYRVEGELRQIVRQNISRLKDIQSYRGTRHSRNLPARGQRTKSNSRTVRGNVRRTAGSGKRKVELK
ncbi:MAG TPA: 30S ribosomal protein S13 [Candidatus Jorgensenbacteria bacterium]|uniref:30S ribosomal protein S13 n=1 Tax=marine sediment metagenome TaxID=412755 RepID=A0A0F9G589_9ZZZZ|nr:30S ribosomal protein S13 [Candidatus Jorgensenbacteria bacterium]